MSSYVSRVLAAFGGPRPTARLLGLPESTVYTWRRKGSIPARRQRQLLALATEQGLALEPRDFFRDDDPEDDVLVLKAKVARLEAQLARTRSSNPAAANIAQADSIGS